MGSFPFQHLTYIQVNIDLRIRSTNTYSSYLGRGMRVVLFSFMRIENMIRLQDLIKRLIFSFNN